MLPRQPKKYLRIPLLGIFVLIFNAYAWKGNPIHFRKFASFGAWLERIIKPALFCLVFALLLSWTAQISGSSCEYVEAIKFFCQKSLVTLLGFGLAMFSLILSLPNSFLEKFGERRRKSGFGPEIISVDLAFPLAVILISIVLAFALSAFGASGFTGSILYSAIAIYSLQQILALIGFLFLSFSKLLTEIGRTPKK